MFLPKFRRAITLLVEPKRSSSMTCYNGEGLLYFFLRMKRALVFLVRIKSKATLIFVF